MESEGGADPSPWPVALWLLFSMAGVAIAVAIGAGLLSKSLILDLVALWPIAGLGFILTVVAAVRGGLWRWPPPLIWLAWLLTILGLHLGAFGLLPSAVGDISPEIAVDEVGAATLTAGPVDALSVAFSDRSELISVKMRRLGGGVAPASATQLVGEGRAEIVLTQRDDPGFFEFEGWDIDLGIVSTWELTLRSSDLSLDTSGIRQASMTVEGAGSVRLAGVPEASVLEVNGEFEITVPAGIGVVLDGIAATPTDWMTTGRGSTAPGDLVWTVIVADGSNVSVAYQGR